MIVSTRADILNAAPFSLNASLINPACSNQCQPSLDLLAECNAASSCFCTDGNIDMFATCIDCMVSVDPGGANGLLGQTAIDGYAKSCAQDGISVVDPTLSVSSSSTASGSQATGGTSNGATVVSISYALQVSVAVVLVWTFIWP